MKGSTNSIPFANLQASITNETNRAVSVENNLQTQITNEVNRATGQESAQYNDYIARINAKGNPVWITSGAPGDGSALWVW